MGPLSSECAPQPATVLPQPPPTFCLPAVRGFLGVLSSVTSGRVCNPPTPPLRNSFGVLHSSPYLSTPFSDYLCFIWEDEGLGKSGIHLCIPPHGAYTTVISFLVSPLPLLAALVGPFHNRAFSHCTAQIHSNGRTLVFPLFHAKCGETLRLISTQATYGVSASQGCPPALLTLSAPDFLLLPDPA